MNDFNDAKLLHPVDLDTSVVFRVKSKGRVLGFCGRIMLALSRVRGLHLHGSQLDIMYVVMS